MVVKLYHREQLFEIFDAEKNVPEIDSQAQKKDHKL